MNIAETVGIAAAIVITTLVSTVSDVCVFSDFRKLREEATARRRCTVRRGGEGKKRYRAPIYRRGDVVILRQGMTVPADGILISGNVKCDQASLTGEDARAKAASAAQGVYPESIKWSPSASDQLFRASLVCRGEEMIAVRVGHATFIGEVAGDLQDGREHKVRLSTELSDLAHHHELHRIVGAAMIAFAYLFNSFVIDSGMDKALILEKALRHGFCAVSGLCGR